jgi:hypothetical protein
LTARAGSGRHQAPPDSRLADQHQPSDVHAGLKKKQRCEKDPSNFHVSRQPRIQPLHNERLSANLDAICGFGPVAAPTEFQAITMSRLGLIF